MWEGGSKSYCSSSLHCSTKYYKGNGHERCEKYVWIIFYTLRLDTL